MQKQEENVCLFLMLLFTKCIILVYYNILLYLLLQYVYFSTDLTISLQKD